MASTGPKTSKTPATRPSVESRLALHKAFVRHGLLLKQDARLPDVVGFLAGGPIRGSWWSHPGAHALFDALQEFAAGPDCLEVKLVAGKDTFVHRRLWPALLGVALSGEAWQTDGLSPEAEALLEALSREGSAQATGPAAKEILARLLAHGRQEHTEAGKHVLRLEPWAAWQKRRKVKPLDSEAARAELEAAIAALGGGGELLPWKRRKRAVKKSG